MSNVKNTHSPAGGSLAGARQKDKNDYLGQQLHFPNNQYLYEQQKRITLAEPIFITL